jgi:hypothetical protein
LKGGLSVNHQIEIFGNKELWSDGCQYQTAIELIQNGQKIIFNCIDEKSASALEKILTDSIENLTVNSIK